MLKRWMIAGLLTGLTFSAFAATESDTGQPSDPWQGMNRKVFAFNNAMDRWILKPVAKGYAKITPHLLRRGVSNLRKQHFVSVGHRERFLRKFADSASDTGRFVMNTTLGLGGLFDPAAGAGLHPHEKISGQTFAKWGAGSGPYSCCRSGTFRRARRSRLRRWLAAQPIRYLIEDERTRYV